MTSTVEHLARVLGFVTGACRAAAGATVAEQTEEGLSKSSNVRSASPIGVMRAHALLAEGRKFETREEVRAELKRRGLSAPQMAAAIEVSPRILYAVLYGRHKGLRGQAHRAAVMLGLKDGVVE